MPERWVLNASPVISLARIGQTGLFQALAERVVLPRPVAIEIESGPAEDPARTAIVAGKFSVMHWRILQESIGPRDEDEVDKI